MSIKCDICFRACVLNEGQTGECGSRQNVKGENFPINYGRVTKVAIEPIEKKPFMRYMPGSMVLSYGSFGCNMKCNYCINHSISLPVNTDMFTDYLSPSQLCDLAVSYRENDNIGVAFTYNEPLISPEYIIDTAKHLKKNDMKVLVKTNGLLTDCAADEILEYIDAVNVDLKCFTEEGYKRLGGDLRSVKRFIIKANKSCHTEITTLIMPEENDFEQEITNMAKWIANVSDEIPLVITRFIPAYKMKESPSTPPWKVLKAASVAKESLKYVYTANC